MNSKNSGGFFDKFKKIIGLNSEEEAKTFSQSGEERTANSEWPVYYFPSDTSGEKPYEEFYTDTDDRVPGLRPDDRPEK